MDHSDKVDETKTKSDDQESSAVTQQSINNNPASAPSIKQSSKDVIN